MSDPAVYDPTEGEEGRLRWRQQVHAKWFHERHVKTNIWKKWLEGQERMRWLRVHSLVAEEVHGRSLQRKYLAEWRRWHQKAREQRAQNDRICSMLAQKQLSNVFSVWRWRAAQRRYLRRATDALETRLKFKIWFQWQQAARYHAHARISGSQAATHLRRVLLKRGLVALRLNAKVEVSKRLRAHQAQIFARRALLRRSFQFWHKTATRKKYLSLIEPWVENRFRSAILSRSLKRWVCFVRSRRRQANATLTAVIHYETKSAHAVFDALRQNVRRTRELDLCLTRWRLTRAWAAWRSLATEKQNQEMNKKTEQATMHRAAIVARKCLQNWNTLTKANAGKRLLERVAAHHCDQALLRKAMEAWFSYVRQRRVKAVALCRGMAAHRDLLLCKAFAVWRKRYREAEDLSLLLQLAEAHDNRRLMRVALSNWKRAMALRHKKQRLGIIAAAVYHRRVLRQAFNGWYRNLKKKKAVCRMEQLASEHSEKQVLHTSLRRWRSILTARRKSRGQRDLALAHAQQKLLRNSLVAWHKWVKREDLRRKTLLTVVESRNQRLLRQCLTAWFAAQRLRRQDKERIVKLENSRCRQLLIKYWRLFDARFLIHQHRIQKAQSFNTRSAWSRCLVVFQTWRNQVNQRRSETQALHRAGRHHEQVLALRCLLGLLRNARERKDKALKRQRADNHQHQQLLKRTFGMWTEALSRARASKQANWKSLWARSFMLKRRGLTGLLRHWRHRKAHKMRLQQAYQQHRNHLSQSAVVLWLQTHAETCDRNWSEQSVVRAFAHWRSFARRHARGEMQQEQERVVGRVLARPEPAPTVRPSPRIPSFFYDFPHAPSEARRQAMLTSLQQHLHCFSRLEAERTQLLQSDELDEQQARRLERLTFLSNQAAPLVARLTALITNN